MRLAFVAADTPEAQRARDELSAQYEGTARASADVIVALGGDGFMLETLHDALDRRTPIYGMNLGTVGFLLNVYSATDLRQRIERAQKVDLHPLRMKATLDSGETWQGLAVNEVSVFRETRQAAALRIEIDGVCRAARAGLRRPAVGPRRPAARPTLLGTRADHPAGFGPAGADAHQPVRRAAGVAPCCRAGPGLSSTC